MVSPNVLFSIYYIGCCISGIYVLSKWRSLSYREVKKRLLEFDDNKIIHNQLFIRLDNENRKFSNLLGLLGVLIFLPIRLFLLALVLFFVFTVYGSVDVLIKLRIFPRYSKCSNTFILISRYMARVLLYIFGLLTIEEEGTSFKPCINNKLNEHLTIVSNHISPLDILYYIYIMYPRFVAKASVSNIFIVGSIAKSMNCIFVKRSSSDDRKRVLNLLKDSSLVTNENNSPIVIFPEGTTTNGNGLLGFKRGAFYALKPVSPAGNLASIVNIYLLLVLRYESSYFHPSYEIVSTFVWLWMSLISPFPIYLRVRWLEKVQPDIDENQSHQVNVDQFKEKVSIIMNKILV